MSLLEEGDIKLVCAGIAGKLEVLALEQDTYFPRSQKPLDCAAEVIFFAWACLWSILEFPRQLSMSSSPGQTLLPLLIFIYRRMGSPTDRGLLFVCSHLLIQLSTDRDFSLSLNKSFSGSFPFELPLFTGAFSDLLILATSNLLLAYEHADTLCVSENLLMALSNSAPFIRGCGPESSLNLLKLL